MTRTLVPSSATSSLTPEVDTSQFGVRATAVSAVLSDVIDSKRTEMQFGLSMTIARPTRARCPCHDFLRPFMNLQNLCTSLSSHAKQVGVPFDAEFLSDHIDHGALPCYA